MSENTDITHVRLDSEDSAQQDQQSTSLQRAGDAPVVHKAIVKHARSAPSALEESEAIRSKIAELELTMGSTDLEKRDAAKVRRKTLLKVEKVLQSKSKTTEEKMAMLFTHISSVITDQGKLDDELIIARRKAAILTKEKEHLQGDVSRRKELTERLQDLCRELQKENKRVSDERAAQMEEEVARTKKMLSNFENSLRELTATLDNQAKEGIERANENESLRKAYQTLSEKFVLQQDCFDHQLKAKDMELQLAALKLEQEQVVQKKLQELVVDAQLSQKELEANKADLQAQLATYSSRFEELSRSIEASTGTFADLKKDLTIKADTIKKLQKLRKNAERENQELRVRCERSNASVVELMDELAALQRGQQSSEEMQKLKNQCKVLSDLCRALQQELKATKSSSSSAVAGAEPEVASLEKEAVEEPEEGHEGSSPPNGKLLSESFAAMGTEVLQDA